MEVLKLTVDYDGYYGGDVHEYCLLPIEWNGMYAEKLEEGTHERAVYLGEIEGKHSEVYGDLEVEIIDLSKLTSKESNSLINNSNECKFEITFEGWEDEFDNEYEDDEEEYEVILTKQKEFEENFGIKFESEYVIKTMKISEQFIDSLKSNIVQFETITIKETDKEKVVQLLNENGIEMF